MKRIALGIALALMLCGCAANGSGQVERATAVAVQPRPPGYDEHPKDPGSVGEVSPSCDPRASYRPGGSPGAALDRIRRRGLLRVGGQQTYYKLSYRNPIDGEMYGFEVELAREIAKAILGDGTKIQFVSLSTTEREAALRDDRVDIVLASMTMTCERWKTVAFSTEYITSGQRVLVPKRSPVTSINDLGGKKVCASTGGTNITEIARAPSHPIPVGATNATDCLVLLQQGQVDAVSTGELILAGLEAQDPNNHIVGERFGEPIPVGAAMRTDAIDLVRSVNGVFETLRANGRLSGLHRDLLRVGTVPAPVYRD